ncbi:hypothetical protein AU15_18615 [Marinobacter salarius]|uniref:Uncharacterized protein n=1 Tax=Marinobacter salarius TaxID=1420917 RepID=W5YVX4_9GAMM|nr:hypothetical protein AU15_18615 [Marinobacter salarius]
MPTEWTDPHTSSGVNDTYGAYYIIPMRDGGDCMNFIMHKGDEKDLGDNDKRWHFGALGNRIFTISGSQLLSPDPIEAEELAVDGAKAHWLDANTLVFADTASATRVELRYDAGAGITVDDSDKTLNGGTAIELSATTLSPDLKEAFPHLAGWPAYSVDTDSQTKMDALRGQLIAGAYNGNDELISLPAFRSRVCSTISMPMTALWALPLAAPIPGLQFGPQPPRACACTCSMPTAAW